MSHKNLEPKIFLSKLQETLSRNKIDYEAYVDEFGQVEACEKRRRKIEFTFEDHLKGLILSLLSNQRPWKKVAENINEIHKIFFEYKLEKVKGASPDQFTEKIQAIGCGNRAIKKQMESLSYNIDILLEIKKRYGSLDKFVSSDTPKNIAIILGGKGEFKLKQIGITLAFEYLRNVGVDAIKPDLHIMRILSNKRLHYLSSNSETEADQMEAVDVLEGVAKEINCSATYLDNLLWILCADGYGEICSSEPKCEVCELSNNCNYPK
jgi:endonuclease III